MTTPMAGSFRDGYGDCLCLPSDLSRIAQARRFVTETIGPSREAPPEEAALLTSELVSNAIIHAGGEITVRVRCDGTRALVEVHDHSSKPPMTQPLDSNRVGGNGLRIIDALAADWGVTQIHDDGKIVWFEIPLPS